MRISNQTIISTNIICQTVMILIMANQQLRMVESRIDGDSYFVDPKLFNASLINFTYFFDCIFIPVSILILIAIFIVQLISIGKLTCFLTPKLPFRLFFLVCALFVTVLYCNDVTLMMAYYWGMPAFDQTYMTFALHGYEFVNQN